MPRVLLVGTGAREHALAWKLRQSAAVDDIFVAPGNGGTTQVATNVPIQPRDIDGLVQAAKDLRINFYLASMDDPQPLGLVDRLSAEGIPCYGPTAAASRLESSKAWAKEFMTRHGIRTAGFATFGDHRAATAHVDSQPEGEFWVKASGLAAGKGAIGCNSRAEAHEALEQIMVRKEFGSAGDEVVIEQSLHGWETSAHAFCDGRVASLMPFASDHKRALDGNQGLNTGGMGAFSPSDLVSPDLTEAIRKDVVARVMTGMKEEGIPFSGTLFPGLIITDDGLYVLEFNARFGDPEAQVLMPRLESDLFEVCSAAAAGGLANINVRWSSDHAVGVVLASGGYPSSYETGYEISGLEAVDPDVVVFQAGTRNEGGRLVTSGGRVLTVVATAETLAHARERAYDNARRISFKDVHYRRDIATSALRVED
ncbi:MAG TPA: phosphoribosylamine--glycine ligase [Dehalococcoidia bacterium]|nr:phosphoribosylamine--glycine ligase [Dehalococcoidia bacterium]